MWRYYLLLSAKSKKDIDALKTAVQEGREHPKAAKVGFAAEMVARFHGADAARTAVEDFEKRFAKKELDPNALPQVEVSLQGGAAVFVTRAVAEAKLAASNTEARKLITQGGVRVNGEKVTDPKAEVGPGEYVIQVGKLKAAKVRVS
jgi:tyrosyl-tRNA synthetase